MRDGEGRPRPGLYVDRRANAEGRRSDDRTSTHGMRERRVRPRARVREVSRRRRERAVVVRASVRRGSQMPVGTRLHDDRGRTGSGVRREQRTGAARRGHDRRGASARRASGGEVRRHDRVRWRPDLCRVSRGDRRRAPLVRDSVRGRRDLSDGSGMYDDARWSRSRVHRNRRTDPESGSEVSRGRLRERPRMHRVLRDRRTARTEVHVVRDPVQRRQAVRQAAKVRHDRGRPGSGLPAVITAALARRARGTSDSGGPPRRSLRCRSASAGPARTRACLHRSR